MELQLVGVRFELDPACWQRKAPDSRGVGRAGDLLEQCAGQGSVSGFIENGGGFLRDGGPGELTA